MISGEKNSA